MTNYLCRAQIINSKQWIEGYVVYQQDCTHPFILPFDGTMRQPVIENTISRYIGVTDKNDCKIYENDILKSPDNRLWHVHYYPPFAMYMLHGLKHNGGSHGMTIQYHLCEVIGNIIDTPHLLNNE